MRLAELNQKIDMVNASLALNGSAHYIHEQSRNGYKAIDLYGVDVDGRHSCLRMLEGGTAIECLAAAYKAGNEYYGQLMYNQGKPTRKQAYEVLKLCIDFEADYHTLNSTLVDGLVVWARLCKYRKPRNYGGSTARAFFVSLSKFNQGA
jgi:hypothetical protein